ncbi:MAG TPA: DUF4388 domain-containing protein, partial [Thermoanaerobaculia bacterium]|nr:DUF4388 domain-containing protein [Thermoanaerobaculia bacterium]
MKKHEPDIAAIPAGEVSLTRKSTPLGRVFLEGDLAAIQLPDVLSFIAMIRHSGRLVLRLRQLERTILWKEGEIAFATSNSKEHSLGEFLLANGKITEEQFAESKRRVTPTLRHGKGLVMMGALSPKDLWWGVKHQVLEIIYSLFTWKEGRFYFCELSEQTSQERITLSINTSSVIMEGIRRIDEVARIRERITGPEMVFARVPGIEPDMDELDLSDQESRLIEQIDGVRTIRELIGLSGMTEFEVTRILFQLLSARVIEVVYQQPARSAVFLDVEDSPELIRVVTTYNLMFARLYEVLAGRVGQQQAREILGSLLQSSDTDELWNGVFFDEFGRFDENMLIANVSELSVD